MGIPPASASAGATAAVRAALQRQDLVVARLQFLCLPSVQLHHQKWLDWLLGDIFTASQFDVVTAARFLEDLPDPMWTLYGCRVLHEAKLAFEEEFTREIRQPMIILARLVNAVRTRRQGVLKLRAETYWHAWFSPTIHAIVEAKPLVIESSERREAVYAASATFSYDGSSRNVFAWRQQWTPKLVQKEQWRFVPVDDTWDRFYIRSVAYNEYLYVDASGVFTWRKATNPHEQAANWQLVPIGSIKNSEFAIYNPHSHEYLCTHDFVFDDERRFLSTTNRINYPLTAHRWRVLPQRITSLEKGLASFYSKQYADAELHLSRALESKLAVGDQVSCYAYRMVARARLLQKNGQVEADFDALQRLGGSKAAEACGLSDLWKEGASALGVPIRTDETPQQSPAEVLVETESLMVRGNYLLTLKDYDRALAVFREVLLTRLNPYDRLQIEQCEAARLNCVKCLFMVDRTDQALILLEEMEGKEGVSSVQHEVEMHLWRGRCRRKLKHYEDAYQELEIALDKLTCLSESATPRTTCLRESIITELRVVGIFQHELLSGLLDKHRDLPKDFAVMEEPHPETDTAAEQLVHAFRCPITFDYVVDPVVTPSGHTYERAAIEACIKKSPWDPVTRAPLSSSQLYPNRALKQLKETMLSEHPLGNLLAACDS